MGKLIMVILAIFGLGAGVGAGIALRPPSPAKSAVKSKPHAALSGTSPKAGADASTPGAGHEYVKLNNQFIVPVVRDGKVVSLVVLSLSLETIPGQKAIIYQREPRLRDAFLQVLFDHANTGGFDGDFTSGFKLDVLRRALREMAVKVLGPRITDVLITGIVRQDT